MIKLGSIKVISFVTMYFKYHVYARDVQYFKTSAFIDFYFILACEQTLRFAMRAV